MVFSEYAKYCDLYYATKDYGSEVDFILRLASRFNVRPKTVLDMGCGTGRHLAELAKRGLKGAGFDQSAEMLKKAKSCLAPFIMEVKEGDLRTL